VVAGYVDSCTYLGLFGIFVAQLTGSFVVAGAEFVRSEPGALAKLLAIPFFFLSGMAVTILNGVLKERPRAALVSSLAMECVLLAGLLVSCLLNMPFRNLDSPGVVAAVLFGMSAMGAQSAIVRRLLQDTNSTNVMTANTTTLAVKAGEMLLAWFGSSEVERPDPSEARRKVAGVLPVWLGFFAGTTLGAVATVVMGLPSIALAVLPVAGLAVWYARA